MTAASGSDPEGGVRGLLGRLRGTLKTRLALVIASAVIVPMLYAMVQGVLESRRSTQRSIDSIERLMKLVDSQVQRELEGSTKLLRALARNAVVLAGGERCREVLTTAAEQATGIVAISLVDEHGYTVCSSNPVLENQRFADRLWFTEAVGYPGRPVLGEVIQSIDPAVGSVMAFALTFSSDADRLDGVLVIGLVPDQLIALAPDVVLPDDATITILDRHDAPIASRGRAEHIKSLTAMLHSGKGRFDRRSQRSVAADGGSWTILANDHADPAIGTTLVVGLPYDAWNWLSSSFLAAMVVPTLILVLVMLVVWGALDVLVTRPVVNLITAVRSSRSLDEPLAPALSGAPSDLLELATAFDDVGAESRRREAALHKALAERNLLIREIHHRVKNNLQIVTSLLNLRASRLASPAAVDAMREAQLRIKSLAVVHRLIYELDELSDVALEDLLSELAEQMHDVASGIGANVTVTLDLEPVIVSADQATPIALIAIELLSNCGKHAFPDGRAGEIAISLHRQPETEGHVRLSVRDNGIGIDAEHTACAESGLGRTLVAMLAKQLGGEIEYEECQRGTGVSLTFVPKPESVQPEPTAAVERETGPGRALGRTGVA